MRMRTFCLYERELKETEKKKSMASEMTTKQQCDVRVVEGEEEEKEEEEEEEGMVWSVSYRQHSEPSTETDGPSITCCDSSVHSRTCSCLSHDRRERIRTPRAGTVEKLVEYLAPYRTECRRVLQDMLPVNLSYFHDGRQTHRAIEREEAAEKATVQKSVVSFIRQWLETQRLDFYSPPSHPVLRDLESLAAVWGEGLAHTLADTRKDIKRKTLSLDGDKLLGDVNPSLWLGSAGGGQQFSLFSLPAMEFVHCLTSEDKYIFTSVVPHECLGYARSPRSAHAPTIRAAINHFNRVSLVTMATVLGSEGGPEERGRVIGRWVEIAQHCRQVKNFSSLLAVLSGLQSGPVFRLKKAWENVSREKMVLLEELAQLFAATDNFYLSRDLLFREGTSKHVEMNGRRKRPHSQGKAMGVIPYLGTFLTDLTMTNTAFPDTIHSKSGAGREVGLVNFDKRRKEFHILAQLGLYQKSASLYSFPHSPSLVHWLSSHPTLSLQQSHELSLALEPDQTPLLLHPPPPSTELSPRHTIRRALRVVFRAAVGDSSQFAKFFTSGAAESPVTEVSGEKSCHLPSNLRHGQSSISTTQSSSSSSPTSRRVRVAVEDSSVCLYRTISVSESDRAGAVVKEAMKKHGIKEIPLIITCSWPVVLTNTGEGDRLCRSCYDDIKKNGVSQNGIKLGEEPDHDCQHKPQLCPNEGCGEMISKPEFKTHWTKRCNYRNVNCKHCKEKMIAKDLEAHYVRCPEYPVKCERCSQSVKKSGLEDHVANHCQFVECSCGDIVKRKNWETHFREDGALFKHMSSLQHLLRSLHSSHRQLYSKLDEKQKLMEVETTATGELSRVETELKAFQSQYENRLTILQKKLGALDTVRGDIDSVRRDCSKLTDTSKTMGGRLEAQEDKLKQVQGQVVTSKGRPSSGASRYGDSFLRFQGWQLLKERLRS
ncbi:Ral guanine nucleotide dissociation stimulator-like 1 [Geodia barretti]|uniref:Ral guanine nucleotide dissociation stimulator-like 1 n=1 Tax=Geodia barretti TaxID=519541 RepID=A0AA35SZU8_GEOBA|nr:Ral guanine nucleotide dissociation stimulator-like 1 [Geodia barretti]